MSRQPLRSPLGRQLKRALSLAVLAGTVFATGGFAADLYLLKTAGHPVGTVTIDSFEDGSHRQVTHVSSTNHLTRMGLPFESGSRTRYVESGNRPEAFEHTLYVADDEAAVIQGRFDMDGLNVRWLNGNQWQAAETPLEAVTGEGFYFPAGERLRAVYRDHYNDNPGARFQYNTLYLALGPEVVTTDVTVGAKAKMDIGGTSHVLRQFTLTNPDNAQTADTQVEEWRDETGKLYKAAYPARRLEMLYAAQSVASASSALDTVRDTSIIANRVELPRQVYRARYRIATLPGQAERDKPLFQINERQRLLKREDGNTWLEVGQILPEDANALYPVTAFDQEYLSANGWIQPYDREIAMTAKQVAAGENRAYYAIKKLHRWVYEHIVDKTMNQPFATAAETIRSKEGDCTEHAVLLASLARSLGIPARVAVGLVYMPHEEKQDLGEFVFHMWTEVYIGDNSRGNWVPVDASFPEFRMDATHLKITDSSLADANSMMALSRAVADAINTQLVEVVEAISPGGSVISVGKGNQSASLEIPKIDIQQIDIQALSREKIKRFNLQPDAEGLSNKTAEGRFSHAVLLLSQGDYDQATSILRALADETPNPFGHYELAKKLLALEVYQLAEQELARAAEDPMLSADVAIDRRYLLPEEFLPSHLEAAYLQALALKQEGDYTGAVRQFKHVADQAPSFAMHWLHLGEMAVSTGEYGEAYDFYQRFTRRRPHDPRGHAGLGRAAMKQESFTQAAGHYQQAVALLKPHPGIYVGASLDNLAARLDVAEAMSLLAANRNNAAAWVRLGNGLFALGSIDQADKALHNAVVVSPDNPATVAARFRFLIETGQRQEAKSLYDEKLSHAEASAEVLRLKGLYETRHRHYRQAEKHLLAAIEKDPSHAEAYHLLSDVYTRLADLNRPDAETSRAYAVKAADILRRGIDQVHDEMDAADLKVRLARIILEDNPAEADRLIGEALQQTRRGDLYVLKAQTAYYNQNPDEAERYLKRALIHNPADSLAHLLYGHVYLDRGQVYRTLGYYQDAVKFDPTSHDAAAALNRLVTRYEMPIKKVSLPMQLSDDERDYVINLYMDLGQASTMLDEYFARSSPLLEKMLKYVKGHTLESINANKRVIEVSRSTYQDYIDLYDEMQAIQPPPRLARLHFYAMHKFYSYMRMAYVNFETFSQMDKEKLLESLEGQAGATAQADVDDKLKREINRLKAQVTPEAYKHLVGEADVSLEETMASVATKRAAFIAQLTDFNNRSGTQQKIEADFQRGLQEADLPLPTP